MLARFPEHENCCPRRNTRCLAIQVVIVPLSVDTMASSRSSRFNTPATTAGFIGTSSRDSRSCMSARQSLTRACAFSRNERSSRRRRKPRSRSSVAFTSPVSPISTG